MRRAPDSNRPIYAISNNEICTSPLSSTVFKSTPARLPCPCGHSTRSDNVWDIRFLKHVRYIYLNKYCFLFVGVSCVTLEDVIEHQNAQKSEFDGGNIIISGHDF